MNDEGAFLAAIIAQPDDDTVRLVFADWLQEHGQPERAEFIRLQIRESHVPPGSAEGQRLSNKATGLFRKNEKSWLADFPAGLGLYVSETHFERGFFKKLHTTAAKFSKIPKRLWAKHPIQELELYAARGKLDRVLALPQLNRIREIILSASSFDKGLLASDLNALEICPNLTGVRSLRLITQVGNPLVVALARCPSLRGLECLILSDDNLDHEGMTVLAKVGADNLRRLKRLKLNSRRISAGMAEVLARAPALAELEELSILRGDGDDAGRIGSAGAAALARSPHLTKLPELLLEHQGIGPEGARALAETRHLTGLRKLWLGGNPLNAAGVRALVRGPWTELTELRLNSCELEDDSAEALAESGRLTALTVLDLAFNRIGSAGAVALSRATWLKGLVGLILTENPIGDEGASALCEGTTLENLQMLRVPSPHGEFSPAVMKALEKRFGDDAFAYTFFP